MNQSSMQYRKVGSSGLKLSALGLGGWTTFGGSIQDPELAKSIIIAAFEAGINFFDIADIYAKGEAEKLMGRILQSFPRHELIISSKVFWPMSKDVNDAGLSRKHILESVDRSLKRIGVDYLDLYFCHRFDAETDIEETARAMDDLVHQGKILYWGTSEWTGEQLEALAKVCDRRNLYLPKVEQPQYNLLERKKFEENVAPACERLGMGSVTWSPLASGALTGKYDQGIPAGSRLERIDWLRDSLLNPENLKKIREFGTMADEYHCERSQLAIAWALRHPNVSSVILGASSVSQLKENLKALSIALTDEVKTKLDRLFS